MPQFIHDPKDREVIMPEEVPNYPGFYYYPENRDYAVSKDGKILNLKTNKFIRVIPTEVCSKTKLIKTKNKYRMSLNMRIKRPDNTVLPIRERLHRILARTFIGRPLCHVDKDYDKLQVNHIDLNPLNNSLDNLEWCTCRENNNHCVDNFGNRRSKLAEIKNIKTKKVILFQSLIKVFKYFEKQPKRIHRDTMRVWLNKDPKGFKFGDYLIRYKDNGYEWGDITSEYNYSKVAISIRNIKVNLEKDFETIGQCARYLGLSEDSLGSSILRKNYKNLIYGNWIIKKSTDEKWPDKNLCKNSILLTNDVKSIYLKKKSDNSVFVYHNVYELFDKLGVDIDAVLASLSKKNQYETNDYIINLFCNI